MVGLILSAACVCLSVAAAVGAQGSPTVGSQELVLRVGLGVVPEPQFPEPGRRFWVRASGQSQLLRGPLSLRAEPPQLAAQVGAFAQPANAQRLEQRLARLGLEVVLLPASGSTRVLVVPGKDQGRERLAQVLAGAGLSMQWVVWKPGTVTVVGGEGGQVQGEEVQVEPLDPLPVQVGGKHYRGRFACLASETGPLVVNRVPLEDYLLGVVPAEMGFGQLEALKAQAVAARSFALVRKGAHAREGFDLCDREHCQVYGGVEAEAPLATQAVQQTQGWVLAFQGQPVQAFFHSTCGGHTEAAEAALTSRPVPYLPGVPCRGETVTLGGGAEGSRVSEGQKWVLLAQRLASGLGAKSPLALARTLGGGSGTGTEQAMGLPDFTPLVGEGVPLEGVLARFLWPWPPGAEGKDPWVRVVLLAALAGVVQGREGVVVPGEGEPAWQASSGGERRSLSGVTVLWREGGQLRLGSGSTAAGSQALLWCAGGLCPVVEVERAEAADQRSRWQQWMRRFSQEAVAQRLGLASVDTLNVVARTATGRVAWVEVDGGGLKRQLSGVELRRALSLPSTWFVVAAGREAGGTVFRFFGRGWGHGVGLCQNGAYGLSLAGWTYERILAHYYPGTRLVPEHELTGRQQ